MNARKLTEHAQRRKQQRGISDLQVELILAFGDDHYQKGGASLSYISVHHTKKSRTGAPHESFDMHPFEVSQGPAPMQASTKCCEAWSQGTAC
jgi:hypothetical protein